MDDEVKDLYRQGYSVKKIAELLAMYEQDVLRALNS